MSSWNEIEDNNEKSGILYALRGTTITPEFRDQILTSLYDEVQNGNSSPKFRYTAIETLETMLPDPAVEEWLRHLGENDPEEKLRTRASRPLSLAK